MMPKMKLIALVHSLLSVTLSLTACQPTQTEIQAASTVKTVPQNTNTTINPIDTHQTHTIQVVLEWEHLQAETITAPDHGQLEQVLIQDKQQVIAGQMLAQFKPDTTSSVKRISGSSVNQAAKAQAYQKWQKNKINF